MSASAATRPPSTSPAAALLGIINDILDFSKMEVGKLDLEPTPFSIRDVVEDVVDTLAERAHSKGLELICDIPTELDTRGARRWPSGCGRS